MKYSLTPPALRTVGAILLGLAAASQCHIAQAKDSLMPCNAAAEHLREFATRNPNLATSDQRFPFNVLASENVSSSVAFVPSSDGFEDLDAVERAINPVTVDVAMREFLRNEVGDSGTSYWYVRDARHIGNLLSIYQIGGSAHCEGGVIFDTADGLLIPLYLYGGEETCDGFGGGFEFLQINGLAFPAIVEFSGQDGRFETELRLLPRSKTLEDYPDPRCSISIKFEKFSAVLEWQLGKREADGELRKTVQSLVAAREQDLRRGEDPQVVFQELLARKTTGDTTDTFERLILVNQGEATDKDLQLTREEVVLFFSGDDWAIEGDYLPLEIDGQKIIVGYGTRSFGWRYRDYETMAFWLYEGDHLFWIASVDFLETASQPKIMVSAPVD